MQISDAELFVLLVGQAPDGIIVADRNGAIRIWNDAATLLLGYQQDEAIGRNLDMIIPEHLRPAHWAGFHKAMATGRTKHSGRAVRTRATHKSGATVYLCLAFAVIKDRNGCAIGAVATARESKDRRQR